MNACLQRRQYYSRSRQTKKAEKAAWCEGKECIEAGTRRLLRDKEVVQSMILGRPSSTSCGILAKLLFGAQFHHLKYGDYITSFMDR